VEIGELLQYYILNTAINFLVKNFIALWRHLAKTQLLCDAQIYLYSVNKRQYAGAYLEGAEPARVPPKLSKGIMHSRENH